MSEPHGIRLPGAILDQLKSKDTSNDERFQQPKRGKKRQAPRMTRKDKRKQERQAKKQKKNKGKTVVHDPTVPIRRWEPKKTETPKAKPAKKATRKPAAPQYDSDEFDEEEIAELRAMEALESEEEPLEPLESLELESDDSEDEEEAAMAKLKALKAKKQSTTSKPLKPLKLKMVKESELGADDDSLSEDFGGFDEDDHDLNEDDDEEDALAKLKALKSGKKAKDTLRVVKESDLPEDDLLSDDFGFDDEDMEEGDEDDEEDDAMAALAALKKNKKSLNKSLNGELRVVKEDELPADDLLSDDDLIGDEDEDDELMSEQEFGNEDDDEDLLSEKEEEEEKQTKSQMKKSKKSKNSEEDVKYAKRPLTEREKELIRREEEEMAYYAKKLGIKDKKKSKLPSGEDDGLDDLLEGLDLDFGSGNEAAGSEDLDEEDDTDGEASDEEEILDDDDGLDNSDDDDNEDDDEENPYVAATKYVPPALRRKMESSEGVSEEVLALRKELKGPLNRLSEANVTQIIDSLNQLYLNHPRNVVLEELTSQIINSVVNQGRLLDTFVYLHAIVVVAIHRLQGVEFGAYFIQTLVEKIDAARANGDDKDAQNLVVMLLSVYMFQLVGSRLVYDVIRDLLSQFDETTVELLLKFIRNLGNQMRSDDPLALKEIVLATNEQYAKLPQDKVTPRIQFLVETISSLKNNKLKPASDESFKLASRLRKILSQLILLGAAAEPIQVLLDDIRHADERGKWWLVGAAWKGDGSTVNRAQVARTLADAKQLWTQLAGAHLMNSDVRKAVFISIKQAEDYIDALTKIDKLGLKKTQEREVPLVLLLCMEAEPVWNPYYGVLAKKLCQQHSYRKTFQFMFWDYLREIENGDDELDKVMKMGRFYGHLLGDGLPWHALRNANFVTGSLDLTVFLEVMFVTYFDKMGKACQVKHVGVSLSAKDMVFDGQQLSEALAKANEQTTMLKGLLRFLPRVAHSQLVQDSKRTRKRVEWGVNTAILEIEDLLRASSDDV